MATEKIHGLLKRCNSILVTGMMAVMFLPSYPHAGVEIRLSPMTFLRIEWTSLCPTGEQPVNRISRAEDHRQTWEQRLADLWRTEKVLGVSA